MQILHSDYGDVSVEDNARIIHLATTGSSDATLVFQAIGEISPNMGPFPNCHILVITFLIRGRPLKGSDMSGHPSHFTYDIAHFECQSNTTRQDIDEMLTASGIPSECAQVMEYFCTLIAVIAIADKWTHANIKVKIPESRTDYEVKTVRYSEDMDGVVRDEACGICFDDFMEGAEVGRIKCGHIYHDKCLRQWLERKRSCPFCRALVQRTYVWL